MSDLHIPVRPDLEQLRHQAKEFDCHDVVLATQGTPLGGTTLLHMAVDFDEDEIFE